MKNAAIDRRGIFFWLRERKPGLLRLPFEAILFKRFPWSMHWRARWRDSERSLKLRKKLRVDIPLPPCRLLEFGHRAPFRLERASRIYQQQRADKHKLYSMQAPEVECIAKGKEHKKYEFAQ
jgi:hypothetical protein